MVAIKSFADITEDIELVWLWGFQTNSRADWFVGAAARGLVSGDIHLRHFPIGMLPVLALARCFSKGELTETRFRGEVLSFEVADVSRGREVTSADIPGDLFPVKGFQRGIQRVFQYEANKLDIFVPAIELIRYLFVHNKTMANALMRPSGILELCRPERLGYHKELHLHFTSMMPVRTLTPEFVQEFAWVAVHPEGRVSWDSVAARSSGQQYVSVNPPPLRDSKWIVRGLQSGRSVLVLEIISASGKHHPCDILRFSHPSMTEKSAREKTAEGQDVANGNGENVQVREQRDYVVSDDGAGSRTDVNQRSQNAPFKISSFESDISVEKILFPYSESGEVADGERKNTAQNGAGGGSRETVVKTIKISAAVAEEAADAVLPPLEFRILEPADPSFVGELAPLLNVLRIVQKQVPSVTIATLLCLLKESRAFSKSGSRRRPCLVAVIRAPGRAPSIFVDVDHSNDYKLSALLLRYFIALPFSDIEKDLKTLLDELSKAGGRWDKDLLVIKNGTHECIRLPRVLRRQQKATDLAYQTKWALKLLDVLGLREFT